MKIEIDVEMVFRIKDDESSIRNFIYKLGAARLDKMILEETDEAVRNFVFSIPHYKILELSSEIASIMIKNLNEKFNKYGVLFEYVSIKGIRLPWEI